MSHDIEAAWASSEIAIKISETPSLCLSSPVLADDISTYAGREGMTKWPHADGLIEVSIASTKKTYSIAVEYKRPNEGLHGVLTAFGQAHAYLRKGYAGSVIVLPKSYPGLIDVGEYAKDILNNTSKAETIGVFVYDPPDSAHVSPFRDKINLAREFNVDKSSVTTPSPHIPKTETQWAHVREGSTDPDAFFRYLQAVKLVSGDDFLQPPFSPPAELSDAVNKLKPGANASWYLSFTSGDTSHDRAWRYFWFKNILHKEMMVIWEKDHSGKYSANHVRSNIIKSDGSGKKEFFSGRADSNKNKVVDSLNDGSLDEPGAWKKMAEFFHNRAHSYREDIDSGLEKIGFLDQDGRLTDAGFRFLDACEKSGDPNSGVPKSLLSRALIDQGGMGALLHYIHKLSDELFSKDPLRFVTETKISTEKKYIFDQNMYLDWLEDSLANRLHVMRKVSKRGGISRKPFQGELAVLRRLGLVMPSFRVGVGIPINWPEVQKVLEE